MHGGWGRVAAVIVEAQRVCMELWGGVGVLAVWVGCAQTCVPVAVLEVTQHTLALLCASGGHKICSSLSVEVSKVSKDVHMGLLQTRSTAHPPHVW